MNTLPKHYKEGITRVTSLVSFMFPFEGTDGERRYLDWLKGHNINPEEYVKGACDMGTEVHNALEAYILDGEQPGVSTDVLMETQHGIDWLDELGYKKIETELYVREENEQFQGAVDLLYTDKDGKVVLADWKTYGIVKKRYGLPNKFAVATDKKKKVRLQMSIYAYALAQQGIDVSRIELLFLHEEGIKIVELDLHPPKEIDVLLASYKASLKTSENILTINDDTMYKIEITVPTIQYGNAKISMDLSTIDNGKTPEENIDGMLTVGKYMQQEYKKKING